LSSAAFAGDGPKPWWMDGFAHPLNIEHTPETHGWVGGWNHRFGTFWDYRMGAFNMNAGRSVKIFKFQSVGIIILFLGAETAETVRNHRPATQISLGFRTKCIGCFPYTGPQVPAVLLFDDLSLIGCKGEAGTQEPRIVLNHQHNKSSWAQLSSVSLHHRKRSKRIRLYRTSQSGLPRRLVCIGRALSLKGLLLIWKFKFQLRNCLR
jgi:hypothetical protein